jgi:hypothetical protein
MSSKSHEAGESCSWGMRDVFATVIVDARHQLSIHVVRFTAVVVCFPFLTSGPYPSAALVVGPWRRVLPQKRGAKDVS